MILKLRMDQGTYAANVVELGGHQSSYKRTKVKRGGKEEAIFHIPADNPELGIQLRGNLPNYTTSIRFK